MVKRTVKTRKPRRKAKRRVQTAYDRMKPWIGIYDSSKHPDAPFDAANAKKEFAEYLDEKERRRNAKRPR